MDDDKTREKVVRELKKIVTEVRKVERGIEKIVEKVIQKPTKEKEDKEKSQ